MPIRKTNSHLSRKATRATSRRPTRQAKSITAWIPARPGMTNHRPGSVSERAGTANATTVTARRYDTFNTAVLVGVSCCISVTLGHSSANPAMVTNDTLDHAKLGPLL